MKIKSIIILLVIILIGVFVWGYSTRSVTLTSVKDVQTSTNSPDSLVAPESLYDFGRISMRDGNVSKEFTILNPTEADITLSKIVTSCMCTTSFLVNPDGSTKGPFGMVGHGVSAPVSETIPAGENRIVRVVYDPNAHGPAGVGPVDRFVLLTDSSGNELELEIKALVTP